MNAMRKYETSDRLNQLMAERNWKQVDIINNSKKFQEKLGVQLGKSALSQYVNGVQAPDQKKLSLLALTFDVSEAWLMGYDVPREREVVVENEYTTFGFEPNENARNFAKQKSEKTVFISNPELTEIENESLDAITLWHVFEHIEEREKYNPTTSHSKNRQQRNRKVHRA